MQLSKSAREVSKFASVALVDIDSDEIQVYVKYFDITFIPSTIFFFNAHHMKMDFGYMDYLPPSSYFLIVVIIYLFLRNSRLDIVIVYNYLSAWIIFQECNYTYDDCFLFVVFYKKLFQQLSWMSKKPFLILLTSSIFIIYFEL
ncbi:hypothetical protein SO802_031106 [Lithocarpus litseifolius]|uniref:Uncharacterized protein n=1 Tax=Lithocarpus litseifolius TaxID=425828 RepID=A0AAW2BMT4_9ROSI